MSAPQHLDQRDWRSELIYFLLPDRFADGREDVRPALDSDPTTTPAERVPGSYCGPVSRWYWNHWAVSGRNRFQGGTLAGIKGKLDYLQQLGVTALWLGPVWKQRSTGVDQNCNVDGTDDAYWPAAAADLTDPTRDVDFFRSLQLPRDDYHGYAIQHFGRVDPRFGTENDLIALVEAAHGRGIRVIFDILINHSGENFAYGVPGVLGPWRPPFRPPHMRNLNDPRSERYPVEDPRSEQYPFGAWLDENNRRMPDTGTFTDDDAIGPESLRDPACYDLQGNGTYGGDDDANHAAWLQFRVCDYRNRDFFYPNAQGPSVVLDAMVDIWTGWMRRTGCDGFRVDTFKHVPTWVSQEFVRRVQEYAADHCAKPNFLVMGEIGGGEPEQAWYLDNVPGLRALELADRRNALRDLAGGDVTKVHDVLTPDPHVGDLPLAAERLVMTVDDHDGLSIPYQLRLAAAKGPGSVLPAAAFLLFGPSIPCLYYGTEQALSGPVGTPEELRNLKGYGFDVDQVVPETATRQQGGDRYLREAMFGPEHPRQAGPATDPDPDVPGFGPRGTAGFQVFNRNSYWYRGIAALAELRGTTPALATGAIRRLTVARVDGGRFTDGMLPASVVAWQRRLDAVQWGVVVVSLAPDADPTFTIDLALPGDTTRYRLATAIDRFGPPQPAGAPIDVARLPQSDAPYLELGPVRPGEIRVYVSA